MVLLCCAIWSCVTKFDQKATTAAGSPIVYVCFAKLLTGMWAAIGAALAPATDHSKKDKGEGKGKGGDGRGAAMRSMRLLSTQPSFVLLLVGIAFVEGFYMLVPRTHHALQGLLRRYQKGRQPAADVSWRLDLSG